MFSTQMETQLHWLTWEWARQYSVSSFPCDRLTEVTCFGKQNKRREARENVRKKKQATCLLWPPMPPSKDYPGLRTVLLHLGWRGAELTGFFFEVRQRCRCWNPLCALLTAHLWYTRFFHPVIYVNNGEPLSLRFPSSGRQRKKNYIIIPIFNSRLFFELSLPFSL